MELLSQTQHKNMNKYLKTYLYYRKKTHIFYGEGRLTYLERIITLNELKYLNPYEVSDIEYPINKIFITEEDGKLGSWIWFNDDGKLYKIVKYFKRETKKPEKQFFFVDYIHE